EAWRRPRAARPPGDDHRRRALATPAPSIPQPRTLDQDIARPSRILKRLASLNHVVQNSESLESGFADSVLAPTATNAITAWRSLRFRQACRVPFCTTQSP